ncbi:MAG: sodium ion-translocating decarboxylase subunit beta [Coprococcus sp.]
MKKILGIVAGIVGIISVIVGVALKMNNNAIAIIGGVDDPTSVFVAGKLNSVLVSILLIAIGVVMLIVAIIFYFLKKNSSAILVGKRERKIALFKRSKR